jgi:hypothetical protein
MAIQTKTVRNALVWYDDRYDNRWVAAAGSNVLTWELPVAIPKDDTTNDPSALVNTEVGTNTVLSSTTTGDRMLVTTGGTEYNGVNLQGHGSAFVIAATKPAYYGCRVAMQNGAKGDYLFGLCEVDTTLLATSAAHAVTVTDDGIYFYQLNDETTMKFNNELGGVIDSTNSAVTTGDGVYHDYEFYYDGISTLYAYVDGTEITTISTGLADQALTPSFNVRAGDDGAEILSVAFDAFFQRESWRRWRGNPECCMV